MPYIGTCTVCRGRLTVRRGDQLGERTLVDHAGSADEARAGAGRAPVEDSVSYVAATRPRPERLRTG